MGSPANLLLKSLILERVPEVEEHLLEHVGKDPEMYLTTRNGNRCIYKYKCLWSIEMRVIFCCFVNMQREGEANFSNNILFTDEAFFMKIRCLIFIMNAFM